MATRKPLVLAGAQVQQLQAGDSVASGGVSGTVVGVTSSPTTNSTSFVQIPEMTLALSTTGATRLVVMFDATFHIFGLDSLNYAIFLDGTEVAGTRRNASCNFTLSLGILNIDNDQPSSTHALLTGVAAGAHTLEARWAAVSGLARANLDQRRLTAFELP